MKNDDDDAPLLCGFHVAIKRLTSGSDVCASATGRTYNVFYLSFRPCVTDLWTRFLTLNDPYLKFKGHAIIWTSLLPDNW